MRFEKGLFPFRITKTKGGDVLQVSANKGFVRFVKTKRSMIASPEMCIWRHLRAYFVTNMTPSVLPYSAPKKK